MASIHAAPFLLAVLLGVLFGLLIWGVWGKRYKKVEYGSMGHRNDILLGLLVLAAFALGVFITYVVLNANT
ncbi:MAG: hypothetical protein HY326_03845 [Chloroflexi bacterium]|nr:hypothetical protein [Chloroflexota bacterium]